MAEAFAIGIPLNLQVLQGLLGNVSDLARSPPVNGSFRHLRSICSSLKFSKGRATDGTPPSIFS